MKTKLGLTNNQLKIIAMVTMVLDHIGMVLLPHLKILRIIGRLSFPIFAYMVGEGFAHSHNRWKYFLQMVALAVVCQVGLYVGTGSLLQCVIVTFSLSIAVMLGIEYSRNRRTLLSALVPILLAEPDFGVDYGPPGILIPIVVCYVPNHMWKLILTALCLTARGFEYGGIQWFCLAAVLLLLCYNGQRGSRKLKYLFYVFYPLHLAVIYGIDLLHT